MFVQEPNYCIFPFLFLFQKKNYAFLKHCATLVKERTNTLTGSHFSLVHCLSKLTLELWQVRYMERKFADKPLFGQQELGGRQICRPNWSFIIGWGVQIRRDSNMHIKRHHESPGTRIIYPCTILKGEFWMTFTFYHNTLFPLHFLLFIYSQHPPNQKHPQASDIQHYSSCCQPHHFITCALQKVNLEHRVCHLPQSN